MRKVHAPVSRTIKQAASRDFSFRNTKEWSRFKYSSLRSLCSEVVLLSQKHQRKWSRSQLPSFWSYQLVWFLRWRHCETPKSEADSSTPVSEASNSEVVSETSASEAPKWSNSKRPSFWDFQQWSGTSETSASETPKSEAGSSTWFPNHQTVKWFLRLHQKYQRVKPARLLQPLSHQRVRILSSFIYQSGWRGVITLQPGIASNFRKYTQWSDKRGFFRSYWKGLTSQLTCQSLKHLNNSKYISKLSAFRQIVRSLITMT